MRAQMFAAALRAGRSGGSGGGGLGTISISDETVTDDDTSPASASAFYELQSDGNLLTTTGSGSWLIGSTSGFLYECRATLTSGTLSSGTAGSWLALSSTRRWTVSRASLGSKNCTFTLEIGLAGANTALDTASITLSATVML